MKFNISDDFYYSHNGEWIQLEENLAAIGLTDFRLSQLGEILFLDLPEEGKMARQGEVCFSIESARHIHDFIAPVSGTIVEVNHSLFESTDGINDDPFNNGWIVKIEMDNEKELSTLMRAPDYKKFVFQSRETRPVEVSEPSKSAPALS